VEAFLQDWEFPHFDTNKDVKLVGVDTPDLKIDVLRRIFDRPFWSLQIEGKWFNYGIISIVMCLDMNMLKNQVLLGTHHEYGCLRILFSKLHL
jgi:hypothetical protein